ncbi:DUF72 domain-containing protein [Ramlibacter sp. MAHUQ-53]|uniref:DUF72 domain-containing protein n=1 Tax=unclassified Ramlibacter TaxID=2617605 RepID=UPI00363C5524
MDNIRVGTASWTDKSLIDCGRFYPRKTLSAEERLRFYASRFPLVEVDSSYYAIPSPANARLWAERTPPGFEFNVKAFRLFTGHQTPPVVLHKDIRQALGPRVPQVLYYRQLPPELRDELWRRFHEALAPLQAAGKLVAVHFQFAPWVRNTREGRAQVAHCVERMGGQLVSVEFRHRSWFEGAQYEATLDFERSLQVAHTIVDAPQGFDNSVPPVWAVTDPRLALLRLHGRNAATWNVQGASAASDRFNYLYSHEELAGLVPPLREVAALARRAHVLFNNNMEDQGQVCAREMRALLDAAQAAQAAQAPNPAGAASSAGHPGHADRGAAAAGPGRA